MTEPQQAWRFNKGAVGAGNLWLLHCEKQVQPVQESVPLRSSTQALWCMHAPCHHMGAWCQPLTCVHDATQV